MRKFYFRQLFVAMLALLCSAAASAQQFEFEGIYYNITSLSDFTVEVIKGDKKYSDKINIPATVTYKSKTLTVTGIGDSAFYDCSNLKIVTIGNNITKIGNAAFGNCI